MQQTPFQALVLLGEEIERTTSRLQMTDLVAQFLQRQAFEEAEVGVGQFRDGFCLRADRLGEDRGGFRG